MRTFASRRRRNIAMFLLFAVALYLLERLSATTLHATAPYTGWLLLAMVVLLAAYNVRKKLPFLPLGSSASWLQIHIYVGLSALVGFGLHVHWRIPNGVLESILATLFVFVAVSGVFGLIISRMFARRITARGPEIQYERIARMRNRVRRDVERLVLDCLAATNSTAVSEFYSVQLQKFFAAPRHFLLHLVHSSRPRRALLTEIDAQHRYLNKTEFGFMQKIADSVQRKDDLDYQFAHQATLKYWFFAHVPLTYALMVFAALHVYLVHAYGGGLP